jgi:hypothetical protein
VVDEVSEARSVTIHASGFTLSAGGTKENEMNKIPLGLATALLGLAAFSTPASAFPAPQLGASAAVESNVIEAQYRRHRQVCTTKTIVSRNHGRKVVRKVRTCR